VAVAVAVLEVLVLSHQVHRVVLLVARTIVLLRPLAGRSEVLVQSVGLVTWRLALPLQTAPNGAVAEAEAQLLRLLL
jgi:hypothetical protein